MKRVHFDDVVDEQPSEDTDTPSAAPSVHIPFNNTLSVETVETELEPFNMDKDLEEGYYYSNSLTQCIRRGWPLHSRYRRGEGTR